MTAKPTQKSENQAVIEVKPIQEPAPSPDLQLREIRELLFGAQVRQVNTEITNRYQEVSDQLSALTRHMETSFAKLTQEFNNRLNDLSEHLENLNRQRSVREDDLSADIDDLRHKLGEAMTASGHADKELRNELRSEADRLSNELDQRHKEAIERLNATSEELSTRKADRKALADLLETMANNLIADDSE